MRGVLLGRAAAIWATEKRKADWAERWTLGLVDWAAFFFLSSFFKQTQTTLKCN
jgi:hypothetical protein